MLMDRRRFRVSTLAAFAGALVCLCVAQSGQAASPKKGAAVLAVNGIDAMLANANLSWFYNWRSHRNGINSRPGVVFVPMIWGRRHLTANDVELARQNGPILLGFNEPDHRGQANMSVEEALDLWPQLMATGLRLGSPATAGDPSPRGSWMERFMSGAKSRGYRVDFLTVHWYGGVFETPAAVANLKSFLEAVHKKYGLPIWLTEYSLIRWSTSPATYPTWDQQAAFATKSVEMLEKLPFVERYAWFALPPWSRDGRDTVSLYHQDGTPTPTGIAYRAAAAD